MAEDQELEDCGMESDSDKSSSTCSFDMAKVMAAVAALKDKQKVEKPQPSKQEDNQRSLMPVISDKDRFAYFVKNLFLFKNLIWPWNSRFSQYWRSFNAQLLLRRLLLRKLKQQRGLIWRKKLRRRSRGRRRTPRSPRSVKLRRCPPRRCRRLLPSSLLGGSLMGRLHRKANLSTRQVISEPFSIILSMIWRAKDTPIGMLSVPGWNPIFARTISRAFRNRSARKGAFRKTEDLLGRQPDRIGEKRILIQMCHIFWEQSFAVACGFQVCIEELFFVPGVGIIAVSVMVFPSVYEMLRWGFPPVAIYMVMLLKFSHTVPASPIDFCELFAGCGAVTSGLREAEFQGVAMDLDYDSRTQDMTLDAGFLLLGLLNIGTYIWYTCTLTTCSRPILPLILG